MPKTPKERAEDYQSQGGKSRRYVNVTTGEVISRRQYQQRFVLPEQGFKTLEERAKERERYHLPKNGGRGNKKPRAPKAPPPSTPEQAGAPAPTPPPQEPSNPYEGTVFTRGWATLTFDSFDEAIFFCRRLARDEPAAQVWLIANGTTAVTGSGTLMLNDPTRSWATILGKTQVDSLTNDRIQEAIVNMRRNFDEVDVVAVHWKIPPAAAEAS